MPDSLPTTSPANPISVGTYTPTTPSSPNSIRKFANADIEASMRAVLSNLPAGKSGAVVAYADEKGVKGAVYGRRPGKFWFLPPGEWSYVGALGVDYQGHLDAGAGLMYSW